MQCAACKTQYAKCKMWFIVTCVCVAYWQVNPKLREEVKSEITLETGKLEKAFRTELQ